MEMNIISFDLGQPSVGHKSLFQQRITIKDMVHKICHYIWKGVRGNKKQQSQNHQQTCIGLLPKKKKKSQHHYMFSCSMCSQHWL